jgi:hypothetical protein
VLTDEQVETVRAQVARSIAALASPDPRARAAACDALNDVFEYTVSDGYRFREDRRRQLLPEIEAATRALLALAVEERAPEPLESALHALFGSAVHAAGAGLVDWAPLLPRLDGFNAELAGYALACLAQSGDLKYQPAIAAFLRSPDDDLRREAAEALETLARLSGAAVPPP